MGVMLSPANEAELADMVASTATPLRVSGGGTRDIGVPVVAEPLSTAGLSGISLYDPGALTLVAGAGTPMAEIEAALNAENQRLAFEPSDLRALLGGDGAPTIGGVVATNASGSRRIAVGACRDHMLGVRFVDGSGTVIKNGGQVMKNVTGYDLVKLLTGSFGTLGVLSEVSLKVLPKPETSTTLILHELALVDSVAAMSKALGSPFEVTGAAMVNGDTCIRIEGFEDSVQYRADQLTEMLAEYGDITRKDHAASATLWRQITNAEVFKDHAAVTRVSITPSEAAAFAEAHWQTLGADLMMDWGGGLMWFGVTEAHAKEAATQGGDQTPNPLNAGLKTIHGALQHAVSAEIMRHADTTASGHATLIKAPTEVRASMPVFQPEEPGVAALSRGLRSKFDPRGILNPGLMGV
jgi:glycolate oxidase FAD binding subunit